MDRRGSSSNSGLSLFKVHRINLESTSKQVMNQVFVFYGEEPAEICLESYPDAS